MIKTEHFEKLEVTSARELRSWLLVNHNQDKSVWLITYKKSELDKYVSRWEVLDELLCFGWIDGIRRKLDEKRTMQLISKRRVQHWTRTYKERVAKLIEKGKLHSSGYESIQLSKDNGLWNFMDDVDNLIIPGDLNEALHENPEAEAFFTTINDSSKRFVLRWLKLAKTEKTRKNRIQKLVNLSARGEKLPGS
ncbi:MAG: YdeI/OmpD-associated family protein [Eudoraea sp.]|nr:YdeI/OmpD-associated family protein [Eudoraea sp.]